MIVSDAGPIIIFARIGRLSLLRDVTRSLLIPDAVYDEIVVKKGSMPGAAEVAQAAWIQKASVANRSIIDGLPSVLHEGEREAITLAKERCTQLLVDELRYSEGSSACRHARHDSDCLQSNFTGFPAIRADGSASTVIQE